MDPLARRALLFDFYGAALRERQRKAFELHHLEDLSLAECAEELGCSRPAALLLVRRAERAMEEMDAAVGAIAQHEAEVSAWQAVRDALRRGELQAVQAAADARLRELEADV
ncbi:MAG: sigma factor-like helix-turn-helix DNA-binding protein [Thermaerobacter sp.]|nr:sigma factor-like helix-turn-helix DNA-binding protein [Thermaerobacter sp.]